MQIQEVMSFTITCEKEPSTKNTFQISCINLTCFSSGLAYIFTAHIAQMTYLLSIFEQLSISNLYKTFWYCAVIHRTVSIHRQATA